MTFNDILSQTLAMLQQHGRVSYRALRRQFALDDDYLADLTEALLFAHPQVVDEEGRGLVWTDIAGSPSATAAPYPSTPLVAQEPHAGERDVPPAVPPPPDAERRQLTVLFCDLVGSTALSVQLDPEDLREVVRAYQDTCTKVIARFEGHIAQYLGDGLLVYFGYPLAHEDDAQRAVRAGLGMLEALEQLNTRLTRERGVQVAVRLGIHTGLVVVGEVGGSTRQEQLALGDTPNIAARLQSLAAPNRVVISERTRQLVGATFDLEALGPQTLKGVPTPMPIYGVRGERAAESRFEAASTAARTPLVGRAEELALVLQRWAQVQAGEGQVVLLTGEPGIGKSRLLQAVREALAAEPHLRLAYQCSPYHAHSAFYPMMVQLERAARFAPGDPPARKLDKLEALLAQGTTRVAEVTPLLAALWSLPTGDRYPPLALSPERHKAQMIAALVDQVAGLSRQAPVLCLVEDAHWCDPTTLEVLDQLVHRVLAVPVLVLITARPEFTAPWTASHITTLTLTRLVRAHVAAMVAHLTAGKALPSEVLAQILARTDGVPLFVEELTTTILESGLLREIGDRYALTGPLPPLAIPATVQDSLMARLDRLAPVKEVAQLGAVLGREFSYVLLAAVSPLGAPALPEALEQLVRAGLLFRHGQPPEAHYRFKHALVQDAAYASLLKSTRQQLHTHIATVLEAGFPAIIETEPEVLARHYTEAGLAAQALPYWQRAGECAIARSANVEAISHLTTGLAFLTAMPDTPERRQQELTLLTALGTPLVLTKGHAAPEVEATYTRARALCQQLGDSPQLFSTLLGLRRYHQHRGELRMAHELGEALLRLAELLDDVGLVVRAHHMLAETVMLLGEFGRARAHAEQGLALYDPPQHRAHMFRFGNDSGAGCRVFGAQALWALGYPDQARQWSAEALAWAETLAHPFNMVFVLTGAARLHRFLREPHQVRARADAAIVLAQEQGFAQFLVQASIQRGGALAEQGQVAEGLAQIRQGLTAWQATGSYTRPHKLALLASVYGQVGQPEEGLRTLTEALTLVEAIGERFIEAELHRLTGALLLARSAETPADAETCFQQALAIARQQQAKSWELRAAMSLSRLWQQQGKRIEAHELLAPIYGWFTEGFDTADIQEAKALLEELKG